MKCAHTVLPFVTLVTSTNRSVLHDVRSILDIGRNGKTVFEQCMHLSELFTEIVHHYKCYQDTYYDSILCKSSAIFPSSDILIINKGGNVLLIGFAFADGMPDYSCS